MMHSSNAAESSSPTAAAASQSLEDQNSSNAPLVTSLSGDSSASTRAVTTLAQQSSSSSPTQEELLMPLMRTTVTAAQNNNDSVRARKIKDSQRKSKRARSKNKKTIKCCRSPIVRMMNFMAKLLFWCSLMALAAGTVWYSYELTKHGTDPHLIAWFSAGAFVLMGFPISMYGIVMHLANYHMPNVQCYVVRILWMVPLYSMESWLCLRFHKYAIYIETLRDVYESYVLYCFLQFLIQVLGGQDELIQILRSKSPTRGVHMWGLQYCGVKPWLMGQPVSSKGGQVQWTSPFFVRCKFGVLQYVLLKFLSSIVVMILENFGMYKEGDFTYKGGYLYICILTNLSQCWALYCMIFFYYATKNELSPIRPVGKFLSVKALVFFTWWQSVGISMLYQMDMIPQYQQEWTSEDVAKGLQDYLICIEMFLFAIVHVFVFSHTDYISQKPLHPISVRTTRRKRLGRRHFRPWETSSGDDKSASSCSKNSEYDLEMATQASPVQPDATITEEDYESSPSPVKKPGFVSALLDSTIPRDVMDSTVGIVKGDYVVEKKTLLHHAATSDQYDLFRASRFQPKQQQAPNAPDESV